MAGAFDNKSPDAIQAAGLGVDASGNIVLAATLTPSFTGVALFQGYKVLRFDAAGALQQTQPVAVMGLQTPNGFAVLPDGSIYVSSVTYRTEGFAVGATGGFLVRMRSDGSVDTVVPQWPFAASTMVAGRDGALYFRDATTSRLMRWTPSEGATPLVTLPGTPSSLWESIIGLTSGTNAALAADARGRVYVANGSALYRYEKGNVNLVLVAGEPGQAASLDGTGVAARFRAIQALATDRDGNVYIADDTLVRRMTPDGVVTTIAGRVGGTALEPGPLPGSVGQPKYLAVSDDLVLYLATGGALVRVRLA